MIVIKLANPVERFIAISIKNNCNTVNGLFSMLGLFDIENIASILSSMNNRGLVIVREDGRILMDPLVIATYELIGDGLEANDYSGEKKAYEMAEYIVNKYAQGSEEIKDILSAFKLRLVEINNEQR